ncbi:hypothetical protein IDF66_13455 [Gordonia hankookensis]|uniref:Uncharacterized protein n=1 Tax=Gordonia hankookensis TaxID=589403 RepID=A0ABR7WCS1_9ACTN|nr:hypothetical protein [Gordonia hankookensis]
MMALATGTACATPDSPAEQSLTISSRTAPTPVSPQDYRYPTDIAGPYNVVWSATDGIDLYSRPAELARAYLESCQLSVYGRKATYPGALNAAPQPSVENRIGCLYPPKGPEGTFPALFGTMYAHIAQIRASHAEVSARGCYLGSGRAEVATSEPESDYLSAYEFSFTAKLPPQAVDPRANVQREAATGTGTRAPQFDVFYPWKFDAVPWATTRTPEPPVSEQPCTIWAAGMLDQIPAYRGQNPIAPDGDVAVLIPKLFGDEGFPTLPQSPAWPAP